MSAASIHIGALVGAGSLWPAWITPGVTYLTGDVLAKLTGPVPCSRLSTTRRPPGGVLIPGPRNGTVVGTSPGAFWRFAPPSHTRGNHGLPCQWQVERTCPIPAGPLGRGGELRLWTLGTAVITSLVCSSASNNRPYTGASSWPNSGRIGTVNRAWLVLKLEDRNRWVAVFPGRAPPLPPRPPPASCLERRRFTKLVRKTVREDAPSDTDCSSSAISPQL
jgi:hypothetical protein